LKGAREKYYANNSYLLGLISVGMRLGIEVWREARVVKHVRRHIRTSRRQHHMLHLRGVLLRARHQLTELDFRTQPAGFAGRLGPGKLELGINLCYNRTRKLNCGMNVVELTTSSFRLLLLDDWGNRCRTLNRRWGRNGRRFWNNRC
jgi:hypothetical protein